MTQSWVTTTRLAGAANIDRRRAHRALARAFHQSKPWRGATLVVTVDRHRPGNSGLNYSVLESSLPLGIQEQLKALRGADEVPSKPRRGDRSAERDWWSVILAPALATERHTRERGAAIAAILARPLTDWRGQPIVLSERNIQRKLAAYELHGAGGLAGTVRADKGITRVAISERWDGAVALPPGERHRIAIELRSYVRGLYKGDTAYAVMSQLAADKLQYLTARACGEAALSFPDAVFRVPRRFIMAESRFRNVAIFDKDRKAWDDAQNTMLRTREGLQPVAIVCADVHHMDIVMHRPDGSEAWPKAIAWLDLATNRIWLDLVLLGKGEGIRNADVIASFMRMVSAWGMPRALYLDNGSEYRWSEFIDDALKLVARVECNNDRDSCVIRAQPYNARAKVIEGIFRILEYSYFRTITGWCGGDRTNKKTANVGKPPEPFPGTIDDLRDAIGGCLTLYETKPQRGALKGRSPRQVYEAALAAGWQRVAVDVRELHSVFATDELRRPRQGYVSFGNEPWTCPELQAYLGKTILLRVPKFDRPAVLPLLDPATRKLVGFAEPARRYGMLDPAGAKASSAMSKVRRAAIRELDQAAPDIDVNAEIARFAAKVQPLPPAPIAATIGISDEAAEIARGLKESSEERADKRRQKALKEQEAQSARMRRALEARGTLK